MSPSASWAKWVMPTRTDPSASPGLRTHSCSAVYFRSSGRFTRETVLVLPDPAPAGAPRGGHTAAAAVSGSVRGSGVVRGLHRRERSDDHLLALLGAGLAAVARLAVSATPPGMPIAVGERGRVADRQDRVRDGDGDAVDRDPGVRGGEARVEADPDAADLDRLGAGGAQLLDRVEQVLRGSAGGSGSVIVSTTPGPWAATVPARMPSASERLRASCSAVLVRVAGAGQPGASRPFGDLPAQPVLPGGEIVEDPNQVLLPGGRKSACRRIASYLNR